LVARGHTVTVLVTNTQRRTVIEEYNGVEVIKASRWGHWASTPLSPALVQQARALRPDLVNLHMPYPPGDLAALAIRDVPLVLTYHSDVVRQRRLLRIYRPLLERTLHHARRIIATSEPYIHSSPFLRRYVDKCRVVPLSVDAGRFISVPPNAVTALRNRLEIAPTEQVILSVGVLRYYKGLHVLLDAMTQLDATLVVVGIGPEAARLQALAQSYGIAQRVHFVGRVSDADLPAYYRAADVFVLPSQLRAEAFGIVLLEAMAAGLPLISTELGTGTSDVNQHGQTGFVVPPADPHALARALQVLLANADLRRYFGACGQRRVSEQYTHSQMLARTLAVYGETLA
jgi:glycosyltransferase involved in cell wall biosynthesis